MGPNSKYQRMAVWAGSGLAVGAALGLLLGVLFDSLLAGLLIGVAIGFGVGTLSGGRWKTEVNDDPRDD